MIPDKLIPLLVKFIQAEKNNIPFSMLEKDLLNTNQYNSHELISAYLLFQEKIKKNKTKKKKKVFRVYSEDEKLLLGEENIEYLYELKKYNLLTDDDIEYLIEKIETEKFPPLNTTLINNYVFFSLFEDKELSFNDILNFYTNPNQTIN